MPLDISHVRPCLKAFDFKALFIDELGWDRHVSRLEILINDQVLTLQAIAEKRGFASFVCSPLPNGQVPDYATRRKIEQRVAKSVREHLIVYIDGGKTIQIWQWVKREPGKPLACREHPYHISQPGDALIQKLRAITFSIEEEENLTLVEVTGHLRAAFDVERVTKRFYDRFKTEHAGFLKFLKGIPDEEMQRWYASVMINRLMFIYFIQKKGFLDNDSDYLQNKLSQSKARDRDRFYSHFLCPLFFEGFAKQEGERSTATNQLLGKVPYLNGGLFLRHQIEERYGNKIEISDAAFEKLFSFFNQYHWHLDERPLRRDNEINPDVLGYIFEKYINQKQMGAYYTKEDITGYISQNTVIPFLFDAARQKCKIAFEGEQSIWRLLQADPDRYLYEAVKSGIIDDDGNIIPETVLPEFVRVGLRDPKARMFDKRYNLGGAEVLGGKGKNLALPTETWREYVERRKRCLALREKLASGEIRDINDLITYNFNIRQFAQDVIENCEGPELLRAFWRAIEEVTILDPTCGSGAFLFAALNILEPLYEASLDRMEVFLDELDHQLVGADLRVCPDEGEHVGSPLRTHPKKFNDFRKILDRIKLHPNRRYFILKSIIIDNLYGVDIMEEAVEICKLRLFLKLVAQVEKAEEIEPLPDIDFNIRAGNTLVGYANHDEVQRAVTSKLDFEGAMGRIEESAEIADRAFQKFHEMQTEHGMDSKDFAEAKLELRKRLKTLEDELSRDLAQEYGISPPSPAQGKALSSPSPLTGEGKGEGETKRRQYDRWLASHKPFHWFIEFYGIMKRGGFDVIIGNPPYVELNVLDDYKIKGYSCEESGNLYALVIERCAALDRKEGRQGYIVPVSSVSTDRYETLQRLLLKREDHYSSYDDRPSRLFDGLEHIRLTIHLIGRPTSPHQLFATRYNKWISDERPALFSKLTFAKALPALVDGSLPKLCSETEESVIRNLTAQQRKLCGFFRRTGQHQVFYSRKVGYFLQVLDFEPRVLDGQGKRRPPSEFKELRFGSDEYAKLALCCLNSNLFYWFVTVFSDCRHVNKREVDAFPINLEGLALSSAREDLLKLAKKLMEDLQKNSENRTMRFQHDTLTVQCLYPKASKPIIDEIDRVLAKHYGFTDEELDFIINYDIKYRIGRNAETDNGE